MEYLLWNALVAHSIKHNEHIKMKQAETWQFFNRGECGTEADLGVKMSGVGDAAE